MRKMYSEVLDSQKKEQEEIIERLLQKLEDLKEKSEKTEENDQIYHTLLNEITESLGDKPNYTFNPSESDKKNYDFKEEKNAPVFACNDIVMLKPFTEEYEDSYLKTRVENSCIGNFYYNPENRSVALSETKTGYSLLTVVVRCSDNAYIGYIGLKDTTKNLWEFAIELLPEYCNQGYGYNAVKLFLKRISEITEDNQQQFMALVEPDNIASQKLLTKLGGKLIDIYDFAFFDEEAIKKFEEENLNEITPHMIELANELMIEPRKLLSHVLDYRLFADKL